MIRKIFRNLVSGVGRFIGFLILSLLYVLTWLAGTLALAYWVMTSMPSLPGALCCFFGSLAMGWLLKACLQRLFPWWNPQMLLDEDEVY